jgi:hypothetical protein
MKSNPEANESNIRQLDQHFQAVLSKIMERTLDLTPNAQKKVVKWYLPKIMAYHTRELAYSVSSREAIKENYSYFDIELNKLKSSFKEHLDTWEDVGMVHPEWGNLSKDEEKKIFFALFGEAYLEPSITEKSDPVR